MNHIGDVNKLVSNTPRTDAELEFDPTSVDEVLDWSRKLEHELNAASKERDDALMMLGMYRMKSDEQKDRIKRLEDIISRAAYAFFRDGSDGQVASGMLTILEEVRKP